MQIARQFPHLALVKPQGHRALREGGDREVGQREEDEGAQEGGDDGEQRAPPTDS